MKNTLCITIALWFTLGSLTAQENFFIAGDTSGVLYYDIDPDIYLSGYSMTHDIDIDCNGTIDFEIRVTDVNLLEGWYTSTEVSSYGYNRVGYYNYISGWDEWIGIGLLQGDTINENIKFTSQCVHLFVDYVNYDQGYHYNYVWHGGYNNAYIPVCLWNVSFSDCIYGWIKVYDVTYGEITLDSYAVDISTSCLPDGITFETQAQIDSFQINHPFCTKIEGDVTITGNDITNLLGLSVLTSIEGDLIIDDNSSIVNLTGLEGLTSIGGGLHIWDNSGLTSLEGMEGLVAVGGILEIAGNTALTSLTDLGGLDSVGGSLGIISNAALTNLIGLDSISSIEYLIIRDNENLSSLMGLEGLTSIGGTLDIGYNNNLNNLWELNNVRSVGQYLSIDNNDKITDLSGLDNVTSIGESLTIKNNELLTSLSGIDNINASSIKKLKIFENPSLSTCEVESVCSYLESPNGEIEIYNNAIGCNSLDEVQDSCEAHFGYDDIGIGRNEVIIFPNPTDLALNIFIEGFDIDEVSIYTLAGQKILYTRPENTTVDISTLQSGMYIVEATVENRKIRRKLLVE